MKHTWLAVCECGLVAQHGTHKDAQHTIDEHRQHCERPIAVYRQPGHLLMFNFTGLKEGNLKRR